MPFEGSSPSLAFFRQLLFVPAAGIGGNPVGKVMQISSKFVRSPKADDTYYEYSDPANLKQSTVFELAGSDTSWTTGARPPMESGSVYALKKCRHIFILGWYCNQSVVSRIVDQLEARGFATRQKRPQNGRIVEVRLTPAGLKMYRSVLPHALAIVDEAVTVLSVGEGETIELLLTRICRHLQEISRRHESG